MPVPVLLVTGFLGAGKTTVINALLAAAQGKRLAAVVNDFGAINIDAELLAGSAEGIVALQNGCICCTLQGDLLRTLSLLLRQDPPPEGIVIETSGVSDPAEIVRSLLDPVIWREAALDAVLCVADARALADRPTALEEALLLSQLRSGDFILLNKSDAVTADELAAVRGRLSALLPARTVLETSHGAVPRDLFFNEEPPEVPDRSAPPASRFTTPGFETLSWTADRPLSPARFQLVVSRLAPLLARAKGVLRFEGQERPMLFQMVGERATFGAAPPPPPGAAEVRLVFIAENGRLREDALRAMLNGCLV
ncbi:CobW family GTP-binding protein [Pararoseomonas indoligenes]|uniref:GTP-binding protein n=1 Tax=Roseomonas indoligenes TaxID=2820811 RepID=A0A940N5F2_9PROT|nr:CobW family GTP-binding protein [Pararoseomonas indoligenes]MBP0494482.1 GTP-binding protein [Pararoseomonas indoligenes]